MSGPAFNAIPLSAIHTNALQLMSQEKNVALTLAEEEKFEKAQNEKGTIHHRTLVLLNCLVRLKGPKVSIQVSRTHIL